MDGIMDISIIIPVYQAESYIKNCLDSIVKQSYKNYEIILVDDGSTDHSIKIAEDFLNNKGVEYSIIHKENAGAASARNTGVKAAKGKRLVFVDSDDYLTENYLEQLVLAADSLNLKVSIVNFKYANENNLKDEPKKIEKFICLNQNYLLKAFLNRKINIVVTAILIDKEEFVSNDLWFDELVRFGEDAIFYWKLLMSQKQVAYNYTPLYNYYVHEGSTTTAPSKEKIRTNIIGFKKLYDEIEAYLGKEFADQVLARQFFAIIRIYAVYMTYDEYLDIYDYLDFDKYLKVLNMFPDVRVRVLSRSLKMSKKVFYWINKKKGS